MGASIRVEVNGIEDAPQKGERTGRDFTEGSVFE